MCTFFEKERNVKPLPFAASCFLKMRKEKVEEEKKAEEGETKVGSGYFPPASNSLSDLSPPKGLRRQKNITNWTFLAFDFE